MINNRTRYTERESNEIIRLHGMGISIENLCERFGRSKQAIRYVIRNERDKKGITIREPYDSWTHEDLEKFVYLYNEYKSYRTTGRLSPGVLVKVAEHFPDRTVAAINMRAQILRKAGAIE
jgi:hypothetical protein